MEEWEAYFHQPKSIEELIQHATIVVDTNVLLSAYQWRDVTVKEMLKALTSLSEKGRLKIPIHVIKEFSKNRPKEITQRINDIENLLSNLQTQKPLKQIVPILEGEEPFINTMRIQEEYNEVLKKYRNGLMELRDYLKKLFNNDDYLESLKNIFSNTVLKNNTDEDKLIKSFEERFKMKKPPGFKDGKKDENSAGDYIIWDSILTIKNDVIFVSGDKKADWVHRDKHENPVSARRELVEEFYRETGGNNFAHITPKEFITLLNPEVSEEVKSDLSIEYYNESNKEFSSLVKSISEALVFYDPMGIIIDQAVQWDEYNNEAELICQEIRGLQTIEDLKAVVKVIFMDSFREDISDYVLFNDLIYSISGIISSGVFAGVSKKIRLNSKKSAL